MKGAAPRLLPYFGAFVGAFLALYLVDPTPGLVLLILGAFLAVVEEVRAARDELAADRARKQHPAVTPTGPTPPHVLRALRNHDGRSRKEQR